MIAGIAHEPYLFLASHFSSIAVKMGFLREKRPEKLRERR
jgi:hypothetical protein